MIKSLMTLVVLVLLIGFVSCACNSTQININNASAEELEKITQIGPSRAQQIISLRPFSSINDLSKIRGIGNGTRLNEIKSQNLACVDSEKPTEVKKVVEEPLVAEKTIDTLVKESINQEKITPIRVEEIGNILEKEEMVNLSPIFLTSKNIKSEENKEIWKRNLSFYGIITFSVIFGVWFLLTRERNKNEFR